MIERVQGNQKRARIVLLTGLFFVSAHAATKATLIRTSLLQLQLVSDMSSLSLSKRLTNKPSRSYLNSEASEDGADGRSVASRDDAGSTYSRTPSMLSNSISQGKGGLLGPSGFSSRNDKTNGTMPLGIMRGSSMRGSRTAASDVGGSRSYGTAPKLSRSPSVDSTGRRSVTFNDLNPALFDDDRGVGAYGLTNAGTTEKASSGQIGLSSRGGRLEVMSDIGGYGRAPKTPSVTSSIIGDDFSDAGSTVSTTRRVRRGSRSERLSSSGSLNINQWHNTLGGGGEGLKSSYSNPLSSIVKRKSSTRIKDLAEAQPSRRYSTLASSPSMSSSAIPSQKTSPSASSPLVTATPQSASGVESENNAASQQRIRRRSNSLNSTGPTPTLPSTSEPEMRVITTQTNNQGSEALSQANPIIPNGHSEVAEFVDRSASTGNARSTKAKTSKSVSFPNVEAPAPSASQAPLGNLHSSTPRNNLLSASSLPAKSARKSKVGSDS